MTSEGGAKLLLPSVASSSLGTNMTSATEQISDNLRSTAEEFTNEYSATVFSLVGIREVNGIGLSGGKI